jgi:hypothetical protein
MKIAQIAPPMESVPPRLMVGPSELFPISRMSWYDWVTR